MCDSVCVDVKILQSEPIQKHLKITSRNSILYKSVKYFKEFMQSFRIKVYVHSETIFVYLRYDIVVQISRCQCQPDVRN